MGARENLGIARSQGGLRDTAAGGSAVLAALSRMTPWETQCQVMSLKGVNLKFRRWVRI